MKTRKFKGFTLIELIVVIAIIGVLAAILIPAMMGWVTKSRITTANNNASEVCTQLQTMLADLDIQGDLDKLRDCEIVSVKGNFSGTNPSPVSGTEEQRQLDLLNANLTDMSKVDWAAKVVDGEVKAVALTNNSSICVGGFPVQCPDNSSYRKNGSAIETYLECAEGTKTWDEIH